MHPARLLKRILVFTLLALLLLAGLFVTFIGPWPTYAKAPYEDAGYYAKTLERMDQSLARSSLDEAPGLLHAGWASQEFTPQPGVPLAGYSGRPNEKRATGVHDPVFARAIVLSDGQDTVALVGLDLLMTSLNLAQGVWERVGPQTGLGPDSILFTSSHTHCGPGGYMPGLVANYSAGPYDPAIEEAIIEAISGAITTAHARMAPAEIAHARAEAPEFIHNRTNVPGADAGLDFLVLRNDAGETCRGVRYSAHATVLPESFLEVSAGYPGALVRRLAERTGGAAVFLGGAVGAMGPTPPKAATPAEAMERMGQALADRVLEQTRDLDFHARVDIASLGAAVGMAGMQVRPASAKWRLSGLFSTLAGVPQEGWIQGIKVGDLLFLGLPYDTGGAIAHEWAAQARQRGIHLWVTSHCIAYCGYLSPDAYYLREPEGYDQWYEWRLMNWFGPTQEAMFTSLKNHAIEGLAP